MVRTINDAVVVMISSTRAGLRSVGLATLLRGDLTLKPRYPPIRSATKRSRQRSRLLWRITVSMAWWRSRRSSTAIDRAWFEDCLFAVLVEIRLPTQNKYGGTYDWQIY